MVEDTYSLTNRKGTFAGNANNSCCSQNGGGADRRNHSHHHEDNANDNIHEPLLFPSSSLSTDNNNVDNSQPQPHCHSTILMNNKGSRARDHLANERTYLAWIRTGLALFGASIALLKWDDFSNVMAYTVAVLGLMVMMISTRRYFKVMHLLDQGRFEPNIDGILFVVVVSSIAIAVAFVLHERNHLYKSHHDDHHHRNNAPLPLSSQNKLYNSE
ncbi:hypothetical protein ACA910_001750 [Epithemia clementina (nom. ined.)]